MFVIDSLQNYNEHSFSYIRIEFGKFGISNSRSVTKKYSCFVRQTSLGE